MATSYMRKAPSHCVGKRSMHYQSNPNTFQREKEDAHKAAVLAAKGQQSFIRYLSIMHQCHLLEIRYRYPFTVRRLQIKSTLGYTACNACQSIEDTIVCLHEELLDPSLPVAGCNCTFDLKSNTTAGYSRCYYEPIIEGGV